MEKQYGHNQRLCTIVFPGLLMVSGVWAMSVGSQVTPLPGEVLVKCSLTEDVRQTKHGVVIRGPSHFGDQVTVLDCDWLEDNPDTPDCISHYGFTLEALENDHVMVSVPRTLLQNDSYTCLVVPQDKDRPVTTCLVPSDDAEDPPTTISAVTSSTAADQPQPRDQKEDPPTTISAVTPSTAADQPQPRDQKDKVPHGANGDHPGGLVPAVVALSFTVFILLLMVIVMAVLFLRLWRYQKRSYSSSSSSSDDDLILPAKRREEEEKKNEVEKQRLMTQTLVDTWGQEDMVVFVPDATCEAENDVSSEGARQATTPDSETSSDGSESALLEDGKPLQTCSYM